MLHEDRERKEQETWGVAEKDIHDDKEKKSKHSECDQERKREEQETLCRAINCFLKTEKERSRKHGVLLRKAFKMRKRRRTNTVLS